MLARNLFVWTAIPFAWPAALLLADQPPTFAGDIAPILYSKCATCHHPGEVAPFSLLMYEDAAKRAPLLAAVTANRSMPPWKPDPGPVPFLNEGRLSEQQIGAFQRWAASGAPAGDHASIPPPPHFSGEWQLGAPDRVYDLPASVRIPPDGPDIYRCIVLPPDSLEKRYVSSFEFKPGNRRVVHHAFLFVDTSGLARRLDDATTEAGYPCLGSPGFVPAATLGLWAPGWPIPPLPNGLGQEIPQGADLVVQIHYHPSGRPEEDHSAIGLKFAPKPEREVESLYLENTQLAIPAGDSHHVETVTATLPMDADLVSILPHAHYLARDLAVDARFPDGTAMRLVHIRDWNLNWQGYYYYSRAVRLPRKTQIELTYLYDNSAGNPRNPSHPPVRVTAGESSRNEMQLAILASLPFPARIKRTSGGC
jgi:hypothetical protein